MNPANNNDKITTVMNPANNEDKITTVMNPDNNEDKMKKVCELFAPVVSGLRNSLVCKDF